MSSDGKPRRYRKASLSDSEIMTILIVFQFGSFRNFKHYYLFSEPRVLPDDVLPEPLSLRTLLMPMWDKIMLRKRCIIETINDMLKNTAQLVHSRHRSVNNFIMNMVVALAAYCFFDNKPQALQGYYIENTKQLMLF